MRGVLDGKVIAITGAGRGIDREIALRSSPRRCAAGSSIGCVQVYGRADYLPEYGAERFFRYARIYHIYEGTTQILQLQIAKHILREFLSGAMG